MTTSSSLIIGLIIAVVLLKIALFLLINTLQKNTEVLELLQVSLDQQADDTEEKRFNSDKADKWFEAGEISELNRYCEQFIADTPNSAQANWYYALANYNQGDYEVAKEYFENVIRINPLWRDGAVVYLQEIASKIGGSSNRTLH